MATAQGFIQPLAQANTLSPVNNGNPNTVYNTTPGGAQRALQTWGASNVPAASYTPIDYNALRQSQAASGWVAPEAGAGQAPVMQLPDGWASIIDNPQAGTPTPPPTVAPPPTTPTPQIPGNAQWVVITNGVPGKNDSLYASDPKYKSAYDQAVAEHQGQFGKGYNNKSSAKSIEDRLKQIYYGTTPPATGGGSRPSGGSNSGGMSGQELNNWLGQATQGGIPINVDRGWAAGTNGDTSAMTGKLDSLLSGLSSNANAGSVMQFLDAISEPFLPGNLYMSQLGAVNMPNVVAAIMNQVIPGLGKVSQWLADRIPQDATGMLGKLRDWVHTGKYQELANEIYKTTDMEDARNQAITGTGMAPGWGNNPANSLGSTGWLNSQVNVIGGFSGAARAPAVTLGTLSNPDIKDPKYSKSSK